MSLSNSTSPNATRRLFVFVATVVFAAVVTTPGIRLGATRGRRDLAFVVVATTLRARRHEGQQRQAEDDENHTNAFHDLS